MSDLLTIDQLAAGYGPVTVVHDVSLSVTEGAVTALVGSNGAGKTTTLRAAAGVVSIGKGAITFDTADITHMPAHDRVDAGIVMVPEGRLIFPEMTVEENLKIGAFVPRARKKSPETMAEIYELFPRLAERRKQNGGTLSGGEQQMLAVGRGLMALPKILLLDEPTLGLAPLMVDVIFDAITKLKSEGLSILLSEQDVGRALEIAASAHVIENGRVVLTGKGTDLLDDPKVKAAYLGI